MMQETMMELNRIAKRYEKYGVTPEQLISIAETAPAGMTEKAAVLGIRLTLAREYGEREYFTLDDVSEVTGETRAEVQNRINAMGIETMQISSSLPGLFS